MPAVPTNILRSCGAERLGAMRFAYAAMVEVLAFAWQFVPFEPHGLVWALFILAALVPLIDWL